MQSMLRMLEDHFRMKRFNIDRWTRDEKARIWWLKLFPQRGDFQEMPVVTMA
jgi:hypothetical protein